MRPSRIVVGFLAVLTLLAGCEPDGWPKGPSDGPPSGPVKNSDGGSGGY